MARAARAGLCRRGPRPTKRFAGSKKRSPVNPQLYPTLADLYARRRWMRTRRRSVREALEVSLRSFDLRVRYAGMLLVPAVENDAVRARDVLREAVEMRAPDDGRCECALLLLAQAERRTGELDASEATARRLIRRTARNPRGYFALAEALEERHTLSGRRRRAGAGRDAVPRRQNPTGPLAMLLPHLGFAYQQLGPVDKAIATFEEAHKLAPEDPPSPVYLIQAQLSAKNDTAERSHLARPARAEHPDDLRLARLEAQALASRAGKATRASPCSRTCRKQAGGDPDGARRARAGLRRRQPRRAGGRRCCRTRRRSFPARRRHHVRARRDAREAEEVTSTPKRRSDR